jgi:hypothetical protein
MKKILSLTFVLLIITSCVNNNERKAKKLIKEHLKATMNDYSSYEPMEFTPLDSTFSKFYDTKEWKTMINERDIISEQMKEYKGIIEKYDRKVIIDMYQKFYDESEIEYNKIQSKLFKADSLFKPKFIGWNMLHQFRGANAFGGKIIGMMTFYFNKEITTVTDVVDLNEKLRNISE